MSFLSDVGNAITQAATGASITDLQAEAAQAQQQITLAVSVIVALEAIVALELFVLLVLHFKGKA